MRCIDDEIFLDYMDGVLSKVKVNIHKFWSYNWRVNQVQPTRTCLFSEGEFSIILLGLSGCFNQFNWLYFA